MPSLPHGSHLYPAICLTHQVINLFPRVRIPFDQRTKALNRPLKLTGLYQLDGFSLVSGQVCLLTKIFVDPPAIPKRILHFEHHQRSPLQTRLYLLVQSGAQRWSLWSNLALHCRKLSCFDRQLRLLGPLPFCPSSNVVMRYPSVVRSPPGEPWICGHCSVTAIRTEPPRRMEGEP